MYVAADKSENVPVPLQHGQVWEPFGRTATSKARGVFFFHFGRGSVSFIIPVCEKSGIFAPYGMVILKETKHRMQKPELLCIWEPRKNRNRQHTSRITTTRSEYSINTINSIINAMLAFRQRVAWASSSITQKRPKKRTKPRDVPREESQGKPKIVDIDNVHKSYMNHIKFCCCSTTSTQDTNCYLPNNTSPCLEGKNSSRAFSKPRSLRLRTLPYSRACLLYTSPSPRD